MFRVPHALVPAGLLLASAVALAEEKPAPEKPPAPLIEPPHRSETIDEVRCRTGYTVPAMRFQLDGVYYHAELKDALSGDVDLSGDTLTLSAAFGITDWLQAKAIVPIVRHDYDPGGVETGIGDITLDARMSFKKGASPLGFVPEVDFCFGLAVGLPSGDEDKGLGVGDPTFQPYASASYWFLPWLGLHGSAYLQLQTGEKTFHGGNAIAEFVPFSKDLSLLAGFEFRRQGTDDAGVAFMPGAEYRITQRISAGLGIPIGLSDRAEDWGLILNAQIGF
jgi:hypothetical protein